MLIKEKQPLDANVHRLEELLAISSLNARQRQLIWDEISNIRAGEKGERDAAYFIDFELRDSKNYAVIHDLRIEHEGRVAQIDHLIIGRMAQIILIESKNITTSLRVNDGGEFEVKTRFGWKGMSSPVEQNIRHADVLGELLRHSGMLPKRVGLQIVPAFHQWVLVPAGCSLGKSRNCADIVKMDMFRARFHSWIDRKDGNGLWEMAKAISRSTLSELATTLAAQHRPIEIDYAAKFGISRSPVPSRSRTIMPNVPKPVKAAPAPDTVEASECATCHDPVQDAVARYCRDNAEKFGGKILCRSCQRAAPKSCTDCGVELDAKVVAFCRFNSKRFHKKLLCRNCQSDISSSGSFASAASAC